MIRFLYRFGLCVTGYYYDLARDNSPLILIACIVLILFIGAAAIGLASAGTTEAIQHMSRY